jgi:hypothetical protein
MCKWVTTRLSQEKQRSSKPTSTVTTFRCRHSHHQC